MAIPSWTVELLRRGLNDVARRAKEPETLDKLKTQAAELMQDLPQTAARGIDAVMRATESGRKNMYRWSQKQTAITIPLINASGVLMTPWGTGVPVAEQAVETAYACLHGDIRKDHHAVERLQRQLHRHLPGSDLPNAAELEIAAASNFQAALLALVLGLSDDDILVHRSQSIRLRSGLSLVDAMNSLVPIVQEVGANDSVELADFESFDSFCLIVADNELHPQSPQLLQFPDREVTQVVVLPVATLKQKGDEALPSVESALKQGADLVIVEGGGIFGGPECGVLIGNKQLVDAITATPIWASLNASPAAMAMLSSTLEQLVESTPSSLPIESLLQTSEDNLRTRAERLAIRLSDNQSIKNCQVTADDARITANGRWRFPSRQVRIEHANLSASQWASQLQDSLPAMLVAFDDDAIKVDLRWLPPAMDGKISDLIGGRAEEKDSSGNSVAEKDR